MLRACVILTAALVLAVVWGTEPTVSDAADLPLFGDGSDGSRTYVSSTTDAPIDSAASGLFGTTALNATNPLFASGQRILIHQSRGSGAGGFVTALAGAKGATGKDGIAGGNGGKGRIRIEYCTTLAGTTNPLASVQQVPSLCEAAPPTLPPFGDGSDGSQAYAANETDSPIDSAASGLFGTTALNATNPLFTPGQRILIHQSRGNGAGAWEMNEIQSYDDILEVITTVNPLANDYFNDSNPAAANKAQVLVVRQYTDVTVNPGVTVTAKAWNGAVGGILAFLANGTVTVAGTLDCSRRGFLGATAPQQQGEGTAGPRGSVSPSPNGNGGGGGGPGGTSGGGGGGGNGTAGGPGVPYGGSGIAGAGGLAVGNSALSGVTFGGGGGNGGAGPVDTGGDGGDGGGFCVVHAGSITVTGAMTANGGDGQNGGSAVNGGGGGAGGSILLKANTATIGSGLVSAGGGARGETGKDGIGGGPGGDGRIRIEYCVAFSGTTNPAASVYQRPDPDGDQICEPDDPCPLLPNAADLDCDRVGDVDEPPCESNPNDGAIRPERIDGTFAGKDDDGDTLVDEPLPAGAEAYDCDGDGFIGSIEFGTPLCGNGVNDDDVVYLGSDDGVVDDGCPGGPAQVGAFSEAQFNIGTPDQDPCGGRYNPPNDGWPLDFVTNSIPDSTNRINILDLTSFVAPVRRLGTSPGHPDFDSRWDLKPAGQLGGAWINVLDLSAFVVVVGTGHPPMLGGVRALNGPECPWPE